MFICERRFQLWEHLDSVNPKTIGFVPTMGNLHDGHLALVREALDQCEHVIASIFVNPIQFGAHEDFHEYPRTLPEDLAALDEAGCHAVYVPTMDEIYPSGELSITKVSVPKMSEVLCGKDRQGHFDGVTTIVCKLLNIVQPGAAYFGEKDWQQFTIISQMVMDLDFTLDTYSVPTQREPDGLAMSSRNSRLSASERKLAPLLYKNLCDVRKQIVAGKTNFRALEKEAMEKLKDEGFKPIYVSIYDEDELTEMNPKDFGEPRIFGAAFLGNVRLIDNVPVNPNP